MGWIAREFFQNSPMLAYPIFALIVFLTVFSFLGWRVLSMDKRDVNRFAQLALGADKPDSDSVNGGHHV